MPTITFGATCPADINTAFDYVAEATNTPEWFFGIKKFSPMTEQTRGLGATFDVVVQIGASLKSTVKCTEYVPNEVFKVESIKGIENSSRWTFSPNADGGTDLNVEFHYSLGKGLAGAALGKLVEPAMAITVKHTTHSLVSKLS
jgi:uncharacterized membrane protein